MFKIKKIEEHAWLKTDDDGTKSIITDGRVGKKERRELERKYIWQMPFSVGLWQQEAKRMLDDMVNPNSVYNKLMEGWKMPKQMIAYHINDNDFVVPPKYGNFHAPDTEWMWGNVVTNKATRTDQKFAMLFCPKGRRMNCITHATFKAMAHTMKHEYINPWSTDQILRIKRAFPSLTRFQAHTLFRSLVKHPAIECVTAGGRCRELEDFHIRLND